jgi:hypothetical protein
MLGFALDADLEESAPKPSDTGGADQNKCVLCVLLFVCCEGELGP